MQIKIHEAYRKVVALADTDLIGKTFEEGIKQIKINPFFFEGKEKSKSFSEFLSFYEEGGKGIYQESGFVIEILIKKFGKEKLIKLLKELKNTTNKQEFDEKFKEVYEIIPNYEFFNRLL